MVWASGCGDGATEPSPPPPDPPRPTTVTVTPATVELAALGATVQLSAEVRDQNGRVMEGVRVLVECRHDRGDGGLGGAGDGGRRGDGDDHRYGGKPPAKHGGDHGAEPDRAALVALYNATDGPNWVDSENWLTDAPLGDWYGVDTDGSGRVVSLELAGRWNVDAGETIRHGLKGSLPPELTDLASLRSPVALHQQPYRPGPACAREPRQPGAAGPFGQSTHRSDSVRTRQPRQLDAVEPPEKPTHRRAPAPTRQPRHPDSVGPRGQPTHRSDPRRTR